MPQIKSAIKRVKTTQTKQLRNRMISSGMKTAVKKYAAVVESGDAAATEKLLPKTVSTVDKAAAKGIIHKNAANRKKAQLAKKVVSK